jgi:hypothetical protein
VAPHSCTRAGIHYGIAALHRDLDQGSAIIRDAGPGYRFRTVGESPELECLEHLVSDPG